MDKPGFTLYQVKFSPDDKAAVAAGFSEDGGHIFVAPIEKGAAVAPDRWLGIDHTSLWDDKPRWSPGGNLIYFVSNRDGHFCLWAQRIDSRVPQLVGKPFPVYHFHNARLSPLNIMSFLEIDVAKDKITLGMEELTGNIWGLKSAK